MSQTACDSAEKYLVLTWHKQRAGQLGLEAKCLLLLAWWLTTACRPVWFMVCLLGNNLVLVAGWSFLTENRHRDTRYRFCLLYVALQISTSKGKMVKFLSSYVDETIRRIPFFKTVLSSMIPILMVLQPKLFAHSPVIFSKAVVTVFRQNSQIMKLVDKIIFFWQGHVTNEFILVVQAKHVPTPIHLCGEIINGYEAGMLWTLFLCQSELIRNGLEAPVDYI